MSGLSVLFDLDGTLVDSAPSIARCMNMALEKAGYMAATVSVYRGLIGKANAQELAHAVASAEGCQIALDEMAAVSADFLDIYSADPAEASELYPDVVTTLNELRDLNCRMAICTNKPSKTALPVLRAFALEGLFDAVVCGDDLPYKKPDARHVRDTLVAMSHNADIAIMIGDSVSDIQAAINAGIPSVLVSFGYGYESALALNPTRKIDHLKQLPETIKNLNQPAA